MNGGRGVEVGGRTRGQMHSSLMVEVGMIRCKNLKSVGNKTTNHLNSVKATVNHGRCTLPPRLPLPTPLHQLTSQYHSNKGYEESTPPPTHPTQQRL